MKNRLAVGALALWVVTIAAAGFVFLHGDTAKAPDGRTAILVSPGQRDYVLSEMRALLVAVRDITDGVLHDDRGKVIAAAHSVGMAAAHDAAPALMAKLPLEFKRMALPLHKGFDDIAAAAQAGESTSALGDRLIGQMDRCIACHAAFRLRAER